MRLAWAAALSTYAVVISLLAGCAHPEVKPAAARGCAKDSLRTLYKGIFTVGTDQPVYPPWYIGDDPSNGEGFESAVAYAVAERLGYRADAVRWVRVPFNDALTPGAKSFDVNLSEFSITNQRKEIVDFSSPYYDVSQAVVTRRSSPAATVTTLAGLKSLRLGAKVGTTSSLAAASVGTNMPVALYNTNMDAKVALKAGQIDALVLDLPTAFAVQSELGQGVVIGELPTGSQAVEQLGIMLGKGSPLTICVSGAVDALRNEGLLAEFERRWLAAGTAIPVLH